MPDNRSTEAKLAQAREAAAWQVLRFMRSEITDPERFLELPFERKVTAYILDVQTEAIREIANRQRATPIDGDRKLIRAIKNFGEQLTLD